MKIVQKHQNLLMSLHLLARHWNCTITWLICRCWRRHICRQTAPQLSIILSVWKMLGVPRSFSLINISFLRMDLSCFVLVLHLFLLLQCLWHCWLGSSPGVWPVKVLLCWCWWFYWDRYKRTLSRVPVVAATSSIIFCCSKIQNGLTFWYRLSQVILETGHYASVV